MTEFVLKSNYFEFNGKLKKQILDLSLLPSLRLYTYVYVWTRLRLNFLKRKNIGLKFSFVTLMSSLFGIIVTKSSAHF